MLMVMWRWMPSSWMDGRWAAALWRQWRTSPIPSPWHGRWWNRCCYWILHISPIIRAIFPVDQRCIQCCWIFQTPHLLLTGRGANLFAESISMATIPTDTLVTAKQREDWAKQKSYNTGVMEDINTRWWELILDLSRCRDTAFSLSLHDKVGLAVIKNTWNCHVLLVFSFLLPAGPTILWEQLLLTLLVMLPVQPPPVESEIKWLAELETLPLLVRQLDFATGALADVFPYLCCVHFFCVCLLVQTRLWRICRWPQWCCVLHWSWRIYSESHLGQTYSVTHGTR